MLSKRISFESLNKNSSLTILRLYVEQEQLDVKGARKAELYQKICDAINESKDKLERKVTAGQYGVTREMKEHLRALRPGDPHFNLERVVCTKPVLSKNEEKKDRYDVIVGGNKVAEVSGIYKVITNNSVIALTMKALHHLYGTYPQVVVHNRSNDYWMVADFYHNKLPTYLIDKNSNDEVKLSIYAINSYDKSMALTINVCFVRFACTNGLVIRRDILPAFKMKHTINNSATDLQNYIKKSIEKVVEQVDTWKRWKKEMVGDDFHEAFREAVVDEEFVAMHEFVDKKRPDGTTCSKWEFFNHVTYWMSHLSGLSFHEQRNLQKQVAVFFYDLQDKREREQDSDYDEESEPSEDDDDEEFDDEDSDFDEEDDEGSDALSGGEEDQLIEEVVAPAKKPKSSKKAVANDNEEEEIVEVHTEENASDDVIEDEDDDDNVPETKAKAKQAPPTKPAVTKKGVNQSNARSSASKKRKRPASRKFDDYSHDESWDEDEEEIEENEVDDDDDEEEEYSAPKRGSRQTSTKKTNVSQPLPKEMKTKGKRYTEIDSDDNNDGTNVSQEEFQVEEKEDVPKASNRTKKIHLSDEEDNDNNKGETIVIKEEKSAPIAEKESQMHSVPSSSFWFIMCHGDVSGPTFANAVNAANAFLGGGSLAGAVNEPIQFDHGRNWFLICQNQDQAHRVNAFLHGRMNSITFGTTVCAMTN